MLLKLKKFFFAAVIVISICFLGYARYEKKQDILEIFEIPYISEVRSIFTQEFKKANYPISESMFWDTELNGVTPKQTLNKKARKLYKTYQILQKKVEMITKLNQADLNITSSDSWNDIKKRMEQWLQLVETDLINSMTEEEVRQYYDTNSDNFRKQDNIEGSLSFWQNGIEVWSKDLSITEENVKLMTEEYDELTEILSMIQPGKGESWEGSEGTYYFVCQSRLSGGIESFDDVVQAAAAQYAQEKLVQLLGMTNNEL